MTSLQAIVWATILPACVLAAPPEEIRTGALGARATVIRDEPPGHIEEDITAVGDVNGDGLADFIFRRGDRSGAYEVRMFLVFGARDLPSELGIAGLAARSTAFLVEPSADTRRGHLESAAPAGDVDRDGFADFFLMNTYGTPRDWAGPPEGKPGVVYLVHGAPDLPREVLIDSPLPGVRATTFTTSRALPTRLSRSAAADGDLNGDGANDLVFGAATSEAFLSDEVESVYGRVYVLLGGASLTGAVDVEKAGGDLPGFVIQTEVEAEFFGESVAFGGDVNGDGFADLLIGATNAYGWIPGSIYIVFGRRDFPAALDTGELVRDGLGMRFDGVGSAARAGQSLAPAGDVNGDGFSDFFAGAPGAGGGVGRVYLIYGRSAFPPAVSLGDLAALDMGCSFLGEGFQATDGPSADCYAGASLALFDRGGARDLVIGAPHFSPRGLSDCGKVYLLPVKAHEPGQYSLGGIDRGELPGGLITHEREREELGAGVAAPGDVTGDGFDDLLVSAASWFERGGALYLIRGTGGAPAPLAVEAIEPDAIPLAGGLEVTVLGAGFDAATRVEIGGREAEVVRLESSARIVVRTPPGEVLGLTEVAALRGNERAARPAAARYVAHVYLDIDVSDFPASRRGVKVRDARGPGAVLDHDGDGLADLIVPAPGGVFILYGRPAPPAEVVLPSLEPGMPLPDGMAYIELVPREAIPYDAGDVNGDGIDDLAVVTVEITVLFGGERFAESVSAFDLVAAGAGATIHFTNSWMPTIAGGADLDGDRIDDLAAATHQNQLGSSPGSVSLIPGREAWPAEVFLDDVPRLLSRSSDQRFGVSAALVADLNGDGRAELLLGAPGINGPDDGRVYLVFGADFGPGEIVEDLVEQGRALRLLDYAPQTNLGYDVAAPGDVNGDGAPDLAMSANFGGVEYSGESYLFFGGSDLAARAGGEPIRLAEEEARLIRATGDFPYDYSVHIAPAGDFNGDGRRDLLITQGTSRWAPARAYVLLGGPARAVSLRWPGEVLVRIAGAGGLDNRPSGGGDFNGDGLDDVAVGGVPAIYLVFGAAAPGTFLRGDASSTGKIDLSDAVFLLNHLFLGREAPRCADAADANDDGRLDITDPIFLLGHLFLGGPRPLAPFPGKGADPTGDALSCEG